MEKNYLECSGYKIGVKHFEDQILLDFYHNETKKKHDGLNYYNSIKNNGIECRFFTCHSRCTCGDYHGYKLKITINH